MTKADYFESYDRVTDILMYFNDNITLSFHVVLSKTNKDGSRRFFQYEVEKTASNMTTRNIKRNMTFYYTIDIKNDFCSGLVIKTSDIYFLKKVIYESVLLWFDSNNTNYAFQIVDDKLALTEYKPALYTQSDIKHLQFEPIVVTTYDNKYSFGIRMILNGLYTIDMELDKFMQFVYYLDCDMYVAACALCNYAKIEPYGIEVFKPYGLGGGREVNNWDNATESNVSYSSTTFDSSNKNYRNSFLDNAKSKKGGDT